MQVRAALGEPMPGATVHRHLKPSPWLAQEAPGPPALWGVQNLAGHPGSRSHAGPGRSCLQNWLGETNRGPDTLCATPGSSHKAGTKGWVPQVPLTYHIPLPTPDCRRRTADARLCSAAVSQEETRRGGDSE